MIKAVEEVLEIGFEVDEITPHHAKLNLDERAELIYEKEENGVIRNTLSFYFQSENTLNFLKEQWENLLQRKIEIVDCTKDEEIERQGLNAYTALTCSFPWPKRFLHTYQEIIKNISSSEIKEVLTIDHAHPSKRIINAK